MYRWIRSRPGKRVALTAAAAGILCGAGLTTAGSTAAAGSIPTTAAPAGSTGTSTGGRTFAVPVSADAAVTRAWPRRNAGHRPVLPVAGAPVTRGYLRFTVTGLSAAPQSTVLRVWATSGNHKGLRVARAASRWAESRITWRNAPARGRVVAGTGPVRARTWVTLNVTGLVRGNGTYTFVVSTPGRAAVRLAGREAGRWHAARLLVTPTLSSALRKRPQPSPSPTSSSTSPTPTPSSSGGTGGTTSGPTSLSGPVRAAFYYPWFPEAWNQSGIDPYTHYHPSLGFYDGSSPDVISAHIAAMQYAGMQAGIASWWGQGSRTDSRIPALLSGAAGTGFRWSLYYEPEGQGDPTVSQITSDLSYIAAHYTSDPSYLYIAGKPVIFVYADPNDACGMVDRWKQANTLGFYVVLKVFSGYTTCANQPDGWHQYGPAVATSSQGSYSFSVSPGFWKASESSPRLARDLTRFTTNVQSMAASNAQFELVTTFNEWGEGTAVESAQEWASGSGYGSYLDVLHQVLGSTVGSSPSPAPTATSPSPSPTSSPSPTPTASSPSPSSSPTTSPSPSPTTSSTSPTPTPSTSSSAAAGPCSGSAVPASWDHVILLVMENHSYSEVIGNSSAPYETSLAGQCAAPTAYHGVTHPSLPNYIAMTSGSTYGITDDNPPSSHPLSGASIFSQVSDSGRQWRSYEETMPSNCDLSSSGNYAVKHNPAAYFTGIASDCARWDVPMGTTSSGAFASDLANNTLPTFAFVTPNLCNDDHNCSVSTGDAWLQSWLPKIFASPAYQAGRTAVFVTFDEDDSSQSNIVPFIAAAPSVIPGTAPGTSFSHYSLLRTIEEMLGLPSYLGNAATATSMRSALHL